MSSLLMAGLAITCGLTQVKAADVQIAVDASQADGSVAQQVTYRRGEVISFDPSNNSAVSSEIVSFIERDVESAGINMITATLNFSSDSDKRYFDYSPGPPMTLAPNFVGSETLQKTFTELRSSFNKSQLPAVIQFSGTPSAFSGELDPNYDVVCDAKGNFYPLPLPGNATTLAQTAIGRWIEGVSTNISDAIWIGSQEPTHTLGFSTAYDPPHRKCSSPDKSEQQSGLITNIDRFISYWTPIAQSIRSNSMELGGIQPNSGDSSDYGYVAQQIISAKMSLDYFTIQNYSPSLTVVQAAYAAYKQLQSQSAYQSVKVIMDRYGLSLSGYNYTSAEGMMHYLIFESQLMRYAEMLYGYSVETAGLHTTDTLLPSVFKWLQSGPAPLRPFTSTKTNVQGFALVQTSGSPLGRIAIWNNGISSTAEDISITVKGYPQALSSANVAILKGSGTTIIPYHGTGLSISNESISGFSLTANEFFLLSF